MGLPVKKDPMQFQVDPASLGKADTLRYNICMYVANEQYDKAVHELKEFLKKDSEYPQFKERSERYVSHAIDLVNAIRVKRKFPGAHYLTMAKQQELNERFREHFQELQHILKRIEKIHVDLKLEDIRSTVWVVRAAVHAAFAIALIAFILEASRGLGTTTQIVVDDTFTQLSNWVVQKLGF